VLAAPVHFELERESVAFVERRKPGAFDGRNVNEGVRLSIIPLDEAESLHRIEELDRSLGLFARELALGAALRALDRHRLAFDSKVRRRNASAAIDESELERLPVCEIGEASLLDGRDVDEDIVAPVIADDEAEAFLGIEELHDPLPFTDDLRGHSATAAATESAATAAAEAATVTASESAAVAEIAPAAEPAVLESTAVAVAFLEEPVALVSTATATIALTPSVETHAL
jgi:hypothetical protein